MDTKAAVLQYLNAHKSAWTNSTQLVAQLDVSRTAIWKAVKQLQQDGQQIESQSGRGYRYVPNQMLNQAIIAQGMKQDCLLEVHQSIDSTNKRAKELAMTNSGQPATIVANEQTGGYGRFGRQFYSPAQTGIYLSFLLPIGTQQIHPGLLTTGTAVAVARVLERQYKVRVAIKWVNDLIVNQHKVAGILSEAVTNFESGQISNVIIGIGVNLEGNRLIPADLSSKVGAINQNHLQVNRNETAIQIINGFWQMIEDFNSGRLMDEYKQRSIVIGHSVTVKVGKQTVHGQVKDVNNEGELVLKAGSGELLTLSAGEITKLNLLDGGYHG